MLKCFASSCMDYSQISEERAYIQSMAAGGESNINSRTPCLYATSLILELTARVLPRCQACYK